nr:unnamed protein product [Digitaria exilis]
MRVWSAGGCPGRMLTMVVHERTISGSSLKLSSISPTSDPDRLCCVQDRKVGKSWLPDKSPRGQAEQEDRSPADVVAVEDDGLRGGQRSPGAGYPRDARCPQEAGLQAAIPWRPGAGTPCGRRRSWQDGGRGVDRRAERSISRD